MGSFRPGAGNQHLHWYFTLKEEKVAVVPGTAFGDSGEGFLRISYAYSLQNLKAALARLERFVEKLRAEQKGQA